MSNREDTIIEEQPTENFYEKKGRAADQNTSASKGKSNNKEKWGYAAGGAVVGSAATISGQAFAANKEAGPVPAEEVEAKVEESVNATTSVETPSSESHVEAASAVTATAVDPNASPAPEEMIIATADGVRVAQVDDEVSFSQAFADARAQVGPGGVFEWRGNVYGTYYKDEWDQMSPAQRSEYQASIDYDAVQPDKVEEPQTAHYAQHTTSSHVRETVADTSAPDDNEVHVIGVEHNVDVNSDGNLEHVAVLESGGQSYLLVDVDRDGQGDVLLSDLNHNNQLDANEVADVRSEGITMPGCDPSDAMMAQASDQPDYMNDANAGLYDA